jgi:hypothetical protein
VRAPHRGTSTFSGIMLVLVAACQATPTGPTPGSSVVAGATPTAAPLATLGPPPSPTPPDQASAVVLDPTVLDFLPVEVGGIPLTESVSEATQALADPSLPKIATAMDAAVAVDAGNGNLVYAWVVRLRPGAFSDGLYSQWRDSYDEGACSGAGGIVGRAEAQIHDRTTYITSCAGGLRTYHVLLTDQAALISASAVGEGKFGELLMTNLRVPS